MFSMSRDMDLDLIGRPGPMGQTMAAMDPRMDMYMPMAEFGPLFSMWAIMMAAMMLPTLVPTLRSYDDLIRSANGSRAGWLGVLAGYWLVWVGFAALITGIQLILLFGGVVDMLGIAKSGWVAGGFQAEKRADGPSLGDCLHLGSWRHGGGSSSLAQDLCL